MEHITEAQPWQLLLFGVGCLVFGVVVWIWLSTGNDTDAAPISLHPVDVIGNGWSALLHWRPVPMSSARARGVVRDVVQKWPEMPTEPNRTQPPNLPNPALESASPPITGAFVLNPQEAAAVGRMIEHKASAEKPNKASIIWAGFGIKKGNSTRYKRASEIYDALFVLQPDFPALEANRQPRWEADQAPAH